MNIFIWFIIILQAYAESKTVDDGSKITGNERHLTIRNDAVAYYGIGQLALATKQLPRQMPAVIGFFSRAKNSRERL